MKDAQKPDHISLTTLIGRLKEGRFVIPDFQREFEWKPWDIRDLMRSIFLDYYIGSLLLWKGKSENFDALACEPIYGYKAATGAPSTSSLTASSGSPPCTMPFWRRTCRPQSREPIPLLHPGSAVHGRWYDDAFHYDWSRGGLNLLPNESAVRRTTSSPCPSSATGGWALANWVQGYEAYWRDAAAAAKRPARRSYRECRTIRRERESIWRTP